MLGLLMFRLYINDMSNVLLSIRFADDTSLFAQGQDTREIETCINNKLCLAVTWLNLNKFSLNVDKTHCMLFTNGKKHRNRINNIFIYGKKIETVSHTKFLGVLTDKKLSWYCHVDHICTKIARGIGILRKQGMY